MEQLQIVYKIIITSLIAILFIVISYFLFVMTQRRSNRPLLSYFIFGFSLLILTSIYPIFVIFQANNLHLKLSSHLSTSKITNELLISVVMIISFIVARFVSKKISQLIRGTRILSLNKMLIQWDMGQATYVRILDEQIIQSLRKWIHKKDETGWLELVELTRETWNNESNLQILLLLSKELWNIEQENNNIKDEQIFGDIDKLKSLLPRFATTSINELIENWEKGDVKEEEIKNAIILNSFKKLISKKDEIGLLELEAQIPEEKAKIRQLVETELWYLNRQQATKTISERIEERRLKSLLAMA